MSPGRLIAVVGYGSNVPSARGDRSVSRASAPDSAIRFCMAHQTAAYASMPFETSPAPCHPVSTSALRSWSTDSPGFAKRTIAATPAVRGAENDVPFAVPPPESVGVGPTGIPTPGAHSCTDGPRLEKLAIVPSSLVAPTVSTRGVRLAGR